MVDLGIPDSKIIFAMAHGVCDLLTVIPIDQLEKGVVFVQTKIIDFVSEQSKSAKDKEEEDVKMTKKKTKRETKKLRPLFTSGEGKKRTFGISTWNDQGKEFFATALENWKFAFNRNDAHYKILHRHWDRWLETAGRNMSIELDIGLH